jgi:hypothetical protein
LELVTDLTTQKIRLSLAWAQTAQIDGETQIFDFKGVEFYQHGSWNALIMRRVRQYGTDKSILTSNIPPLNEQFVSYIQEIAFKAFNSSVVYDPDILIQSLFGLDGDVSNDNAGSGPTTPVIVAIVAVAVVVVAAAGVGIAAYASPKFRAKVFPFLNRQGQSRVSSSESAARHGGVQQHGWVPSRGTRDVTNTM